MISVDAYRVELVFTFIHIIWTSPIQLLAIMGLLIWQLSWVALIGIFIIICLMPVQGYFLKNLAGLRKAAIQITDKRIRAISEIVPSIKVIKYMAWEKYFDEKVDKLRKSELIKLFKLFIWKSTVMGLAMVMPTIAAVVTYIVLYVAKPERFSAAIIFSSLSLFQMMFLPLGFLPQLLNGLIDCMVALKRINGMLNAPVLQNPPQYDPNLDSGIEFVNGQFAWEVNTAKQEGIDAKQLDTLQLNLQEQNYNFLLNLLHLLASTTFQKKLDKGVQPQSDNKKNNNKENKNQNGKIKLNKENGKKGSKLDKDFTIKTNELAKDDEMQTQQPAFQPKKQKSTFVVDLGKRFSKKEKSPVATVSQRQVDLKDRKKQKKKVAQGQMMQNDFDPSMIEQKVVLNNVNLKIPKGKLTCIVGRIGAGKSSLLSAMVGDILITKGQVKVGGQIAYCPQQAWIQNASVKNNILFGRKYEEHRYKHALYFSQLENDIEILPDGDQTEIGERGVNLSGGQKARVNLARAIYSNQDIIILDDVLAAVDATVGKFLFMETLRKELNDKTRILVTHQLHFVPFADYIVHMDEGHVISNGSFREVLQGDNKFQALMEEYGGIDKRNSSKELDLNAIQNIISQRNMSSTHDISEANRNSLDYSHRGDGSSELKQRYSLETDLSQKQKGLSTQQIAVQEQKSQHQSNKMESGLNDLEQNQNINNQNKDYNLDSLEKGTNKQQNKEGINERSIQQIDKDKIDLSQKYLKSVQESKRQLANSQINLKKVIKEGALNIIKQQMLFENNLTRRSVFQEESMRQGSKKIKKPAGQLMTTEERVTGAVGWRIYASYFRAGGGYLMVPVFVGLYLLTQGTQLGTNLWLTYLTQSVGLPTAIRQIKISDAGLLVIYGCLALSQGALLIAANISFGWTAYLASKNLHRESYNSLITAPMAFFDTTPQGRIINRFSRDIDQIDTLLVDAMRTVVQLIFTMLGIFVFVIVYIYFFPAILVPMLIIYYFLQNFYRHTSRELKRLEAINRSPLVSSFDESLNGISTIRAYGDIDRFQKLNLHYINGNTRPYYLNQVAQRWISVRLEAIGGILLLCMGFFSNILNEKGVVSPSIAGLCLTYVNQVISQLNFSVRQIAEAENYMNSVERVRFYIEHVKGEKLEGEMPPPDWPQKPNVEFQAVSLKYRPELAPALRDFSVSIPAFSKVGIVGRTGAGKSTIIASLMRLVELEDGRIVIDGKDISQVALRELRSRVAIIPQDPILFETSLRRNLDPIDQHTDQQIWDALQEVGLHKVIQDQPHQLDQQVSANGENFSMGQRQLFCLVRAMLVNARILIMDEATANVDQETDTLIQKTIRQRFDRSTVLTIAHRLNTIIDYDYALVMEYGKCVEFDSPYNLLYEVQGESKFASMVKETGKANSQMLYKLAKTKKNLGSTSDVPMLIGAGVDQNNKASSSNSEHQRVSSESSPNETEESGKQEPIDRSLAQSDQISKEDNSGLVPDQRSMSPTSFGFMTQPPRDLQKSPTKIKEDREVQKSPVQAQQSPKQQLEVLKQQQQAQQSQGDIEQAYVQVQQPPQQEGDLKSDQQQDQQQVVRQVEQSYDRQSNASMVDFDSQEFAEEENYMYQLGDDGYLYRTNLQMGGHMDEALDLYDALEPSTKVDNENSEFSKE